MVSQGVRAVNLGCGNIVAPGWINIDNSPNARLSKIPGLRRILNRIGILSDQHLAVAWPEGIIVRDIRRRLPFDDQSIDFVYTSHTFEHLTRTEALAVLADVQRVLRPGGVVRVVLPDLRVYIRRYTDAIAANPEDPTAAETLLTTLRLSRGGRDPHKWMYDAPSAAALLREAGLAEVAVCDGRQGRVPDLDYLDQRTEHSVHVEGVKQG